MKVWMDALFLIVIVYFALRFVQTLLKMKQNVLLPASEKEAAQIRKHPEKIVDLPNYSDQKFGIIFYSFYLLFIFTTFILCLLVDFPNWSLYWLFIPQLLYFNNSLNLFAITEDGILTGTRFVSWKRIKFYRFRPIDMNHKYYGFSKEANSGYELQIKAIGFPISVVITSEEMKEKLEKVMIVRVQKADKKDREEMKGENAT